ncbi:MAG TPA: phosphotransferase [Symbiobacteriaceae bacterium]|nr:phosphotransferase [Symbiobacteriaceae bacterium]
MIKEIQAQFRDAILQEAATRYGITAEQLKNLGGFESFVYEFKRHDQHYILKLTHTLRRAEAYIMGEIEWLNFLADGGVSVARAIPSAGGRLVERIEAGDEGAWLAIAYDRAPGQRVTAAEWNGELFAEWGRVVGQMHRLTQSYRLSNPAYKRQEWFEEDQLNARKYLPASEAAVIARAEELLGSIRGLPTPPDAYGMLHTDLSHGNFFVHEGRITAFDFDDCGYNWFASDIAVSLFSALVFPPAPIEDPTAFAQAYLTAFFHGYRQENKLDPTWLPRLHDFLLLRDLLLFIVVHQSWDLSTWNDEQLVRLAEHRNRILEGRALVDLDWMQFA